MEHKTIAVSNQKGGVGKTTTALNLGVELANTGHRVLVVDADPQGSLTTSLGIRSPDELQVTLKDIMQSVIDDGEINAERAVIKLNEGIDLIPSNIELSGMETYLLNAMSREYVLKNALADISRKYDYILIDTMPSLGLMTVNALAAADSVIIPCQPNFLSAKGLDLLFHTIARVRKQINPKLKIDGILLTMVDSRTNNAKEIINSLRETVGTKINIFNAEIPRSVKVAESSLEMKSLNAHDAGCKAAAAYRELRKEVEDIGRKEQNRLRNDRVR